MGAVLIRQYDAPPVCREEILRYAGARGGSSELAPLLTECLAELEGRLNYLVCYSEFSIVWKENALDLGFLVTESRDLQKNLAGCSSGIVFAATVGLAPDRLIARYAASSPTKALLLQAIGAERIEALCHLFCEEMAREQREFRFHPRFSPGYGDLSLDAQKNIFSLLDCPKRIGLTLNQSMLLSPTKSVTALMGKELQK